MYLLFQDDEADAVEAEIETIEVDIPCDNHGPLCDVMLDWTDNQALAELVSFPWVHRSSS